MSQSNVFIFEIQSLAEEESREYKSFSMMNLRLFLFYLYFNIQNMQNIYHVWTITALCYMSTFFTLSVHFTHPDSFVNNNYSQLV